MTGRTMATSILLPLLTAPARLAKAATLDSDWDQARTVGEHSDVRSSVLTEGCSSCCSPQRVLLSSSAILLHRLHFGRNDNEEPDPSHVLRAL